MYKSVIEKSIGLSRQLRYVTVEEKEFDKESEAIEFAEKYINGRYGMVAYIKEKTKVMGTECFVAIKMASMFAGEFKVTEMKY